MTVRGYVTNAEGPNLRMLEWRVPDEASVTAASAKRANPASWISVASLEQQRDAVQEVAFQRYHCNRWVERQGSWLPPGAWQACAGNAEMQPGERIRVGLDVGGERSDTAIVWATEDLRIGSKIFRGDEGILQAGDWIRELAEHFAIQVLVYDPWRAQQLALELEREGLCVAQFPQSNPRLIPASRRLYQAVVERRVKHPNDADLNRHVAGAVAKDTPRGWRIDKPDRNTAIDAVIAMAMAVERAEQKPEPVRLLGWV